MGKKIALLIGISEYQPGFSPLPGTVNDVDGMQRVLENPDMGGFAPEDITVLKNPQRQQIEEAIYHLFINRSKDDLLLFYFSGHGVIDETGLLYFATPNTYKENNGRLVKPSSVAARVLQESLKDSPCQRKVIILDCCYSGAIAKGMMVKDDGTVNIPQQLGGTGRAILTSSTSTQPSFEQESLTPGDTQLSVYTRYIIEGLEKGAADLDGDGYISVKELHDYASTKVKEASPAMTPQFYRFEDGDQILLAKSPQDDPQLKYRKEVEKIASENNGEFSRVDEYILDEFRRRWGLSTQEAAAIQDEVLAPFREYQEKLQRYQQALQEVVKQEYPLRETTNNGLRRFQQMLNLRDEDVVSIQTSIFNAKQAEYEQAQRQQQEAERLRQEELRKQQEAAEKQRQEQERAKTQPQEQLNPKSPPHIPTQQFTFQYAVFTGFEERSTGLFGLGKKQLIPKITYYQATANYFTQNLGNGVNLAMVAIPGGTFMMGSPEDEPERFDSESPQHQVTIQPFFLGKYPITQSQWQAVANLPKVKIDLLPDPAHFKGGNLPIESISWDEAVEFCDRLSEYNKKHNLNFAYRLPSEAEWEYACRAGTTTPFHYGKTITTELANYNGNYTYDSAPEGQYRQQTTEVGLFPPNAFGLYDMHGNVWEWCQDDWHENYHSAPSDGSSWDDKSGNHSQSLRKMLRGGSWSNNPRDCRSACRLRYNRDVRDNNMGFRVVCVFPRLF